MKMRKERRVSLRRWVTTWVLALTLVAYGVMFGIAKLSEFYWDERFLSILPPEMVEELRTLQEESYRNPGGDHSRLTEIYRTWMVDDLVRIDAEFERQMTWLYPGWVLLSLLPVLLGGVWFSRRLSSQVNAVAVAAREIAQGNFDARAQAEKGAPHALVVLRDDFNHMAERLARYDRELQISSAAMAHELRTPLTAAKGRVQALRDGVFPADERQFSVIMRQLDQIDRLVSDLHLLSLASAGQLVLEVGEFDVRELVQERVNWLATDVEASRMRIDLDIGEDIVLRADRDRIGQVLSIALDNAHRHGAEGGWIGVRAKHADGRLTLCVEDAGSGFPEQDLVRVCDRFWRAEASRSRHRGGAGLGLAVAAAICSAHGGRLSVANRPEGGARVVIELPDAG